MTVVAEATAGTAAPPDAFTAEWDRVHVEVRRRLVETLSALEMSPPALQYVHDLRLYQRSMFLLALWDLDDDHRVEVASALCHHVVAMKLFDDLLDDDSPLDRFDLGLCLQLTQLATRDLARLSGDAPAILDLLAREFETICRGQILTKRHPATDLASWRAHAETYGAGFLALYGRLGALAGRAPRAADAAAAFAHGFGMMITIADDLRDYERCGERDGNLAHLILTGRADPAAVLALVDEMHREARDAVRAHPICCDVDAVLAVVDAYAADIPNRALPRVATLA